VGDIVKNNDTAFIVPANNKKLFIKKLRTLIEDDCLRKKMSQNGWNHVKDQFHFKRLVNDMEQTYNKLLE